VRTFDGEGKALGTIGVPGAASPTGVDFGIRDSRERTASISRAAGPFNHPTALAIGAGGTLYITDGYGNARVHRFTRDGVLLDSWGEPGVGPGQFHIPHGIHVDGDGRVLVADRENERIQLFTADGRFVEEWSDVQRPTAIAQDAEGFIYVTELPRPAGYASWTRPASTAAASSRMSVLSRDGQVLDRIGAGEDPWKAGVLAAAHGLAIDSDGDVYVAEVRYSFGVLGAAETGEGASPHSHTFQKFARVKLPAPDS
jgi:sugar lactone lactonase YvrE